MSEELYITLNKINKNFENKFLDIFSEEENFENGKNQSLLVKTLATCDKNTSSSLEETKEMSQNQSEIITFLQENIYNIKTSIYFNCIKINIGEDIEFKLLEDRSIEFYKYLENYTTVKQNTLETDNELVKRILDRNRCIYQEKDLDKITSFFSDENFRKDFLVNLKILSSKF